jgi:hypothetical protein
VSVFVAVWKQMLCILMLCLPLFLSRESAAYRDVAPLNQHLHNGHKKAKTRQRQEQDQVRQELRITVSDARVYDCTDCFPDAARKILPNDARKIKKIKANSK